MDDAEGNKNGAFQMSQSRKQDRYDGLLGWWVSLVLILPTLAWTPGVASEASLHGKGEGVAVSNNIGMPSLTSKMHWGANAMSAPISPPKQMPVIDRSKVDPQLLKSAQGMEGLFINYMLKVMRQTVPRNAMDLESSATQIYRGMMDSEYAEKAVRHGGIGLADQIIAYMSSRGYNGTQGQQIPKTRLEPKADKEKQ